MLLNPESALPRSPVEVSIVMPCLNEAETLAACIHKAQAAFARMNVAGEVVVADNGSSDGSQQLARDLGARVVEVAEKGYGNALRGGIEAAGGLYVIMGDADDSYDFSVLDGFMQKLREGYDLVMGNRFAGGIRPGAMPALHRYLGNPVLTAIGRLFFRSPAGDFHCGLRGFSRAAYERMELQTTGMEFASEMVVAATLRSMRIAEVPIVLHKDGRSRPPHLRSWRDGWRHLRFMLLFSPTWLFLIPGLGLLFLGLGVGIWLMGGPRSVGAVELDIHSLLVAGFLTIVGYQVVLFAAFTRIFAAVAGFLPQSARLQRMFLLLNLERGLVLGCTATCVGAGLLVAAFGSWQAAGFGGLDPRVTMRSAIPAVVLMTLGLQTIFASFFLSILGLKRKSKS